MNAFFGELYLRSTRPFLTPERTRAEVRCLARAFAGERGPVLDVGCGHGRHAAALRALGLPVIGFDLDALSLAEREARFPAVRADFHAPPFRPACGGAYAWYSTLFIGSDSENAHALAQVAACLKPGALLVLQSVPFEWLAQNPRAVFSGRLPDGAQLDEENAFDPGSGVDRGHRRLTTVGGQVLEGTYAIRYYRLPELEALAAGAGLALEWTQGDLDGGALGLLSKDLVVGARRIR